MKLRVNIPNSVSGVDPEMCEKMVDAACQHLLTLFGQTTVSKHNSIVLERHD